MSHTGGRHAFLSKFKVGFQQDGKINSVEVEGFQNAGCEADLSPTCLGCYLDKDKGQILPVLSHEHLYHVALKSSNYSKLYIFFRIK